MIKYTRRLILSGILFFLNAKFNLHRAGRIYSHTGLMICKTTRFLCFFFLHFFLISNNSNSFYYRIVFLLSLVFFLRIRGCRIYRGRMPEVYSASKDTALFLLVRFYLLFFLLHRIFLCSLSTFCF